MAKLYAPLKIGCIIILGIAPNPPSTCSNLVLLGLSKGETSNTIIAFVVLDFRVSKIHVNAMIILSAYSIQSSPLHSLIFKVILYF